MLGRGYYLRAVLINFRPILDGVIHKNLSTEDWFTKTALCRVSFRIFVKGSKRNNCQAKGGQGLYYFKCFSLARNIMKLIDFLQLRGSGGMPPQENFNL